jgi:phospholipase C
MRLRQKWFAVLGGLAVAASGLAVTSLDAAGQGAGVAAQAGTATPIKHLVVIFDENVSFDHYFATYPYAANPAGEPQFSAKPGTPTVDDLVNQVVNGNPTGPLLTNNPNESNPLLLDRSDALTCDQNHGYTAEQLADDHGAMDLFAQNTGRNLTLAQCLTNENAGLSNPEPIPAGAGSNFAVMDYYDGNTVTALWNYAQHFSMSDSAYTTGFGPSTPGAFNVTSAQTYGSVCGPTFATINDSACAAPPGYNGSDVEASNITTSPVTPTNPTGTTPVADQPPAGAGTNYSDADPSFDICSYLPGSDGGDNNTPATTIQMGGNNIGEEMTTAGTTWGWFEGGFDNGFVPGQGTAPTIQQVCAERHLNQGGGGINDYIPHHEPFQYYASTANPMHLPPTSVAMIGKTDQANHQYDIADFWAAADSGHLPQVSFLKSPAYQDGHAGYSDPLDEQTWLVNTINHLQTLKSWKSTAVAITYDDSDGWYDHVLGPEIIGSQTSLDALTNPGQCGSASSVPSNSSGQPEEGKCGVGLRIPFLVVSPYAAQNSVSHSLIDQSSVVKWIESNWNLPAMGNGAADTSAGSLDSLFNFTEPKAPPLYLDPTTGEPTGSS